MATTRTETHNVRHMIRMPNSHDGNPRFRVVFDDQGSDSARDWTSALTKPDAGFVYGLSDSLSGPHRVTFNGRGQIVDLVKVDQ